MVSWIFVYTKPEEGKQTPETTNNAKKGKKEQNAALS